MRGCLRALSRSSLRSDRADLRLRTPHPALRATFSHKGEKAARTIEGSSRSRAAEELVLETAGSLILRRLQLADGRSRAFINHQRMTTQASRQSPANWSKFMASTTTARSSIPARIANWSMPLAAWTLRPPKCALPMRGCAVSRPSAPAEGAGRKDARGGGLFAPCLRRVDRACRRTW